MKIITYSKIGYNHPSQANWSYGIFKIDLIDTHSDCCMSYTCKETFGGDLRFYNTLKDLNITIIKTKEVFNCPKITGISKMLDLESQELLEIIKEFINK